MTERIPPKKMASKIAKLLKRHRVDYLYVKKVFQHVREILDVHTRRRRPRALPELLTDDELTRFYEAVWNAADPTHMVMIKLLIFTGMRNAELANVTLRSVDLKAMKIRIESGKGDRDRYVPIPPAFRGELAQYMATRRANAATYLFETNRRKPYTTRWIRQITKRYALQAGIEKRIYPHLFRHQLLTYLTQKGIVDAKIQVLSGHQDRQSLAIYQDLSLKDIEKEYREAMRDFPIQ